MTNHSSVGYSTLPKYLQVRRMGCYGGVRVKKKVTVSHKTFSHFPVGLLLSEGLLHLGY